MKINKWLIMNYQQTFIDMYTTTVMAEQQPLPDDTYSAKAD